MKKVNLPILLVPAGAILLFIWTLVYQRTHANSGNASEVTVVTAPVTPTANEQKKTHAPIVPSFFSWVKVTQSPSLIKEGDTITFSGLPDPLTLTVDRVVHRGNMVEVEAGDSLTRLFLKGAKAWQDSCYIALEDHDVNLRVRVIRN